MHHFHQLNHLSEYIRSFGYLAPIVAMTLFTVQAAIPIFPYAVLVAASVIIFGIKLGFTISMLGAVLGSVICYWLCRELGADWFNEKILGRWGYDTRNIHSGMAFGGIILAHMVPIFPSAVITMAAAVSGVGFISFTVATTLGLIPATLAYTGLGWYLINMHDLYKVIFTLVIILMVLYLGKNTLKKWLITSEKTVDR